MTTQMLVRIDADKRRALNRLSRAEGKTTSEVVRELIDTFIDKRDISRHVDGLWDRIGGAMRKRGYGSLDINRIIAQTRKASR
jgi:hypothetical protein